jgi:hypothetical protein
MALLIRPLPLHNIDDVERFCSDIVRRGNFELSFHEHEELITFLISECWLLSERYEAGRIRKGFSVWAGITLRKRAVEWDQRIRRPRVKWAFRDRVYIRPVPKLVSFDADDSLRDRLDETVAARSSDPAADSSPDLERFLEEGDREKARDFDALGLEQP